MTEGPRELHLEARGLNKRFGGLQAAADLSMRAQHGEVHAVIGPNGAGKTTLVHMLSGFLRPDSGSILFGDDDITALPASGRVQRGLARSFQITSVFRDFTVLENVVLPIQARQGHSFRFWRSAMRDPSLTDLPAFCSKRSDWMTGPRPWLDISRTASSASWRSRSPWPRTLPSSCSTNQWRAWGLRKIVP